VAGGLLLDGDGRAQAFDQVHVGLVHQLQELAGIGGEALHIAALAFGIQRVKRETGLAGPRQTGDHHQPVARDVQVDVLQVVGARAAHADALLAHHGGQIGVVSGCREVGRSVQVRISRGNLT